MHVIAGSIVERLPSSPDRVISQRIHNAHFNGPRIFMLRADDGLLEGALTFPVCCPNQMNAARAMATSQWRTLEIMNRVVILGRGASGKSTLARCLGEITRLPVIELDKIFWRAGPIPTPRDQWVAVQEKLIAKDKWIMEGDLGPYDVVEVRLRAADTIILLDFSLIRCAWRAVWRSRERVDFWRWLIAYRRQSRPILVQAIANHAPAANLWVLRDPGSLRRFVAAAANCDC